MPRSRSRSPVSRGWRPGNRSYHSSSREDVRPKYKNVDSRRDVREHGGSKDRKHREYKDNHRFDHREQHPDRDRYRREDINKNRKSDHSRDRSGNRNTYHYGNQTKHWDAAFNKSSFRAGGEKGEKERSEQRERPRSNSKTKTKPDLPARYKGVYNETTSPGSDKNEDNLPQQYRHYNRIERSVDSPTKVDHVKNIKEKSISRDRERTLVESWQRDRKQRTSRSISRSKSKSNRKRSASSSISSKSGTKIKNKQTKEQKSVKRKRSISSSEPPKKVKTKRQKATSKDRGTESDSSDSSSDGRKKKRKKNKKDKKRKDKNNKKKKSKKKKKKKESKQITKQSEKAPVVAESKPPLVSANNERKAIAPMTKEQWEKQQSVIRRVLDPDTGRTRLVKGDGEILEEIVSRERHKEINKLATLGDGRSFQATLGLNKY